jgi:hypothetical protein
VTESTPGVRRSGLHRAPRSRRRTLLLLLAAVVVLALATTIVVRVVRPGDDGAPSDGGSAADGPRADMARDVAAWVDAELPADIPLTAPDDVSAALAAAGTAEDRLTVEDPDEGVDEGTDEGTDDGTGALRIVEGDPGADAVVVARFRAADGMLLSVVDPRPVEPTDEELDRRQRLAAAILANPVAGVTGRAAEVLAAAEIDARLLGLLAVLVARPGAGIADLPRAPGQPEEGTPARRALIGSLEGEELVPGSEATERVREFVDAQLPPFAPDTVEVTEDGVLVGFDYSPSPDAEVTAATR